MVMMQRTRKRRKPGVYLTPQVRSLLIEKWAMATTAELALEVGANPVTINKWARMLGLHAHPRGGRRPRIADASAPAPAAQVAPSIAAPSIAAPSIAAPSEDEKLDAILALYGRPKGEPVPPLPADLVAQLNTLTLAVVRETVVSLMRETVAQLAPPLIEQAAQQALAEYTRNIVTSLIRLAGSEANRQ